MQLDLILWDILQRQFITFSVRFNSLQESRPRPEYYSGRGGGQGPPGQYSRVLTTSAEKKPKQAKKKPLNVRKEFPETWLWTEEMVK